MFAQENISTPKLRAKSGGERLKADGLEWLSQKHSRKSSFVFKIRLITTVTYGSFWRLIHQTKAPTFVIKQEKLLHRVNIGGLIEAGSAAVEDCMVDPSIPALLARCTKFAQISTDMIFTFISLFYKLCSNNNVECFFYFILLNLPFLCFAALVFVIFMTVLLQRNYFLSLSFALQRPFFFYDSTLWTEVV